MKIKTLIAVFLITLAQPLWADGSVPELLIKQTADDVLARIKSNKDEYQQQPSKLYAMVDEKVLQHFDFD
ncbi:MAG: ABC transporter substrate-binding protein, partial [Gammaproteobacteria bacterium]|nr:ABC transporter substrate-binding protein [Gammaproteobacteria bacterium]